MLSSGLWVWGEIGRSALHTFADEHVDPRVQQLVYDRQLAFNAPKQHWHSDIALCHLQAAQGLSLTPFLYLAESMLAGWYVTPAHAIKMTPTVHILASMPASERRVWCYSRSESTWRCGNCCLPLRSSEPGELLSIWWMAMLMLRARQWRLSRPVHLILLIMFKYSEAAAMLADHIWIGQETTCWDNFSVLAQWSFCFLEAGSHQRCQAGLPSFSGSESHLGGTGKSRLVKV